MDTALADAVADLQTLLALCGRTAKAEWLGWVHAELVDGDGREAREALQAQLAGGMGSLLDLSLVPPEDATISEAQADALKWDLIKRLDALLHG